MGHDRGWGVEPGLLPFSIKKNSPDVLLVKYKLVNVFNSIQRNGSRRAYRVGEPSLIMPFGVNIMMGRAEPHFPGHDPLAIKSNFELDMSPVGP
jgi:hypothetical protein